MKDKDKKPLPKIIGQALLFASIQSAIGSVEMSSKFSVLSFATNQDILQRASNALCSYIIIALIWTAGSSLVLYSQFGKRGILWGVLANILMMGWIVISYVIAFKEAADRNNLKFPRMFGIQF